MRVAFTHYPPGGEETVWTTMEHIPAQGDTVHLSFTGAQGDSRAHQVTHVSWSTDERGWHAELGLA